MGTRHRNHTHRHSHMGPYMDRRESEEDHETRHRHHRKHVHKHEKSNRSNQNVCRMESAPSSSSEELRNSLHARHEARDCSCRYATSRKSYESTHSSPRTTTSMENLNMRTKHHLHPTEATAYGRPGSPMFQFNSRAGGSRRELGLCVYRISSPHPDKVENGGEDASFLSDDAFGLFDGVGGWAEDGVDPSMYSKTLARLTAEYVDFHGPGAIVHGLKYAVRNNREIGSSTACVASLYRRHLLGVNIGDSGLMVLRDGETVYETKIQQHDFNFPYQLGTDSSDTVDDGERFYFELQPRDLIIMASDGLWDNVLRDSVVVNALACISEGSGASNEAPRQAKRVALSLAKLAKRFARLTEWMSPFARSARRAGFEEKGGKMDDVTIIVALVVFR